MKTKLFALFVAILVTIPSLAEEEYDFQLGEFYYRILGSDSVMLVNRLQRCSEEDGCVGWVSPDPYEKLTTVNIPSYVEYKGCNYAVTTIEGGTFMDYKNITSITLPNSLKSIRTYAFAGCTSLSTIVIPESVTNIGDWAFNNCIFAPGKFINNSNCTSHNDWGANIADEEYMGLLIKENTIIGCDKNIISVAIPNSVKHIGTNAFKDCSLLTSITIPNSVESIGYSAFQNCISLNSIAIPNSVKQISTGSLWDGYVHTSYCDIFVNCPSLKSITVEEGNSKYDSRNNCNAIIETATNSLLVGCNTTIIPDGISEIGAYAFKGCTNLSSITIPSSVRLIGSHAFENCTNISKTNYTGTLMDWCNITFMNNGNPCIYSKNLYINDIELKGNLVLPDSIITLKNYTFLNCQNIQSITIPNSVISIGEYTFSGCSSLTSIVIPNNVTYINHGAFQNCSSLKSVTIGSSVKHIGSQAFYECTSISKCIYAGDIEGWCKIKFGVNNSNPITLSKNLYLKDKEVIDLIIPNTIDSIHQYAFNNCSTIRSVSIPDKIKNIGEYAFQNCLNLQTVYWNAESCSWDATGNSSDGIFYGCKNIKSFVFGDSVKYIPNRLCEDMDSLRKVNIPENVEKIGDCAFRFCVNIDSIVIPNNVTKIGKEAFNQCKSLSTITLGAKLTTIGDDAFYLCHALTSIHSTSTNPFKISNNLFGDTYLKVVFIPKGTTDTYKQAWGTNYTYIEDTLSLTVHVPTPGGLAAEIVKMGYMPAKVTKLKVTGTLNETDYAVMRVNMVKLYSLDLSGITNTSIPASAFENKTTLLEIILPTNLQSIGNSAFEACPISTLVLPNSVTSIGQNAFCGCKGLSTIDFGDDCNIGSSAFDNCVSLKDITVNGTIGSSAFYGCKSLRKATLGNSVISIGTNAFYNCTVLSSVDYKGSIKDWCNISFGDLESNPLYYANNLYIQGNKVENLEILDGISTLKPYVFAGGNFEHVLLDNTVRTINSNAFYAAQMKTVTIGNGVQTIAANTFYNCTNLQKITLGNNVKDMSYNTFYGCTNLDTIICYGLTPAVVANNNDQYQQFTSVDPEECLLMVPESAFVDYILAPVWGAYGNMQLHNLKYYTLTTLSSDATMGYTSIGRSYVANSIATIQAYANDGYAFKQWNDGNTNNPRNMLITSDTTLIAEFVPLYSVILLADSLAGYVVGGGEYMSGDTIEILATPNAGYSFVKWNDEVIDNPRQIIVSSNATYTAIFEKNDVTTNLDNNLLSSKEKSNTTKLLHNGQFLIIRDGNIYTVMGQEL